MKFCDEFDKEYLITDFALVNNDSKEIDRVKCHMSSDIFNFFMIISVLSLQIVRDILHFATR
jgi:hypothetical protein